jgi:hypothetical protein
VLGSAIARARQWGLAIRLAQASAPASPNRSPAQALTPRAIAWSFGCLRTEAAMFGESVERRLKTLAASLSKKPDFLFG